MRLTYRALNQNGEPTGEVFYNAMSIKTGANIFPQTDKEKMALKKLATYEDTGLTPEDIRFIRMTQLITPERLAEIVRAEFDGRLVILPCKVGDTVFLVEGHCVYKSQVESITLRDDGLWLDGTFNHFGLVYFSGEIGRNVFLSREEAEAALKGETEDV